MRRVTRPTAKTHLNRPIHRWARPSVPLGSQITNHDFCGNILLVRNECRFDTHNVHGRPTILRNRRGPAATKVVGRGPRRGWLSRQRSQWAAQQSTLRPPATDARCTTSDAGAANDSSLRWSLRLGNSPVHAATRDRADLMAIGRQRRLDSLALSSRTDQNSYRAARQRRAPTPVRY